MTILLLVIIAITVLLALIAATLASYLLALSNIFFTRVPEGEIIVITYSEKVWGFIGNIDGYWVHPETGEVYENSVPVPAGVSLPRDFFGTGIYWLGIWPLAERYEYEFHWNKWAKRKDMATGVEDTEYSIIPKSANADSIYFRAQYPVEITGCESAEGVPLTMRLLFTVQTTNADTALFKVKSPGWLSGVSGQIMAVIRDFTGSHKVEEINVLQAEVPSAGASKSEFQQRFDVLNNSTTGNPSLHEMFGQKIVAVSFVGFVIEEAKTEPQKASIKAYYAARTAEAEIIASEARANVAVNDGQATKTKAEANAFATVTAANAEAQAIRVKGEAEAAAATLFTAAVKDNPHAGAIAIAEAIQKQTTATTLVLGQNVVPTKQI